MRRVAVVALPGVLPSDLGIACDVFRYVRLASGEPAYSIDVCGETRHVEASPFVVTVRARLDAVRDADIVVVPGIEDIMKAPSPAVVSALRSAHERGAMLASICTGAFVLAGAGLLDHLRATTHWAAADELARRFPLITVDVDALFVDEGNIVTSAGSSAGLDMCLHLIGRQHGQAVAAHAAKLAVAPLRREGGQAPFIRQPEPATASALAPLLDWMQLHLDQPLDVDTLAARAHMTPRTFARRFKDQCGTTPIQWLLTHRIRRAQELLEATASSIEQIAEAAGFGSPVTFRTRFHKTLGLTPSAYRRRFSAPTAN